MIGIVRVVRDVASGTHVDNAMVVSAMVAGVDAPIVVRGTAAAIAAVDSPGRPSPTPSRRPIWIQRSVGIC